MLRKDVQKGPLKLGWAEFLCVWATVPMCRMLCSQLQWNLGTCGTTAQVTEEAKAYI